MNDLVYIHSLDFPLILYVKKKDVISYFIILICNRVNFAVRGPIALYELIKNYFLQITIYISLNFQRTRSGIEISICNRRRVFNVL